MEHAQNIQGWNEHYKRKKARQVWPDENLVRMLASISHTLPQTARSALDLGCGSGRHLHLLEVMDFQPIFGLDTSEEAIRLCKTHYPKARLRVLQPRGAAFPDFTSLFLEKGASEALVLNTGFSVIIAWGVLHYNAPKLRDSLLENICRALAPGGWFFGTLRADTDSHYRKNPDICGTPIEFFSEEAARKLLGNWFGEVQLGYIERRPPGRLGERICHWTFVCQQPKI